MATPNSYYEKQHDPALLPDEKQEANLGYADGLESDSEGASFTALIAEGEDSLRPTQSAHAGALFLTAIGRSQP